MAEGHGRGHGGRAGHEGAGREGRGGEKAEFHGDPLFGFAREGGERGRSDRRTGHGFPGTGAGRLVPGAKHVKNPLAVRCSADPGSGAAAAPPGVSGPGPGQGRWRPRSVAVRSADPLRPGRVRAAVLRRNETGGGRTCTDEAGCGRGRGFGCGAGSGAGSAGRSGSRCPSPGCGRPRPPAGRPRGRRPGRSPPGRSVVGADVDGSAGGCASGRGRSGRAPVRCRPGARGGHEDRPEGFSRRRAP